MQASGGGGQGRRTLDTTSAPTSTGGVPASIESAHAQHIGSKPWPLGRVEGGKRISVGTKVMGVAITLSKLPCISGIRPLK